jgi:hypothetical protein
MAGLECFKLGYIWRVGDGRQIDIWEDNWIPGSHNMKIQTPRGNILVTRVDELINLVDLTLDADLVRSIFWGIEQHIYYRYQLHGLEKIVLLGILTGVAYFR